MPHPFSQKNWAETDALLTPKASSTHTDVPSCHFWLYLCFLTSTFSRSVWLRNLLQQINFKHTPPQILTIFNRPTRAFFHTLLKSISSVYLFKIPAFIETCLWLPTHSFEGFPAHRSCVAIVDYQPNQINLHPPFSQVFHLLHVCASFKQENSQREEQTNTQAVAQGACQQNLRRL